MSYPLPVPQQVEKFLTMATDGELQQLARKAANDSGLNRDEAETVMGLCQYELTLRQQEPLWRKATRTGSRWWASNGNEAEKVGVGALLGVALGLLLD